LLRPEISKGIKTGSAQNRHVTFYLAVSCMKQMSKWGDIWRRREQNKSL